MQDHQPPATSGVFTLRGLEMTRLETFTDAAFAFALSLMMISLDPPTSAAGLTSALRGVPAFLVSGSQLMLFWWAHHQWSRRYGLDDGPTVILSCLLVFTVLIYVVPLNFMFGVFFVWVGAATGLPIGSPDIEFAGPDEISTMFAVYGMGFMAMAAALVLLQVHAWRCRERLRLSPAEIFETRADAVIWAILAGTGGLSTVLALVLPPEWIGLPGMAYMLLPVVIPLYARRMNRRRDRLFGPGGHEVD